MKKWRVKNRSKGPFYGIYLTLISTVVCIASKAQGQQGGGSDQGVNGISKATSNLNPYFDAGVSLMYIIGGLVGLIGAVKVYQKWNHGDHDTSKVAAAWFGSCIFLVIVATVLKSFFNL